MPIFHLNTIPIYSDEVYCYFVWCYFALVAYQILVFFYQMILVLILSYKDQLVESKVLTFVEIPDHQEQQENNFRGMILYL